MKAMQGRRADRPTKRSTANGVILASSEFLWDDHGFRHREESTDLRRLLGKYCPWLSPAYWCALHARIYRWNKVLPTLRSRDHVARCLDLVVRVVRRAGFAPRLKTLAFHLDRLSEITVPDPFAAEKSAKLDELQKLLAAGAQNDEQFNALYKAMDGVRTWLWEHAADKPRRPSGGLEETDVAWVVKTPQLELSIAKADLSMVVTAAQQQWRFLPCDDQDVEGISARFGLQSAKNRTVASFNTGYSVGLTMALSDFPDAPGLELYLTANLIGREIVFDWRRGKRRPRWPR